MNARLPRESPPRARGRVKGLVMDGVVDGITPACAGKSGQPRAYSAGARNHPRVRGEERPPRSQRKSPAESPPRARGRGLVDRIQGIGGGITPACAGKRGIGDYTLDAIAESPPRARGREHAPARTGDGPGITPACAGKSAVNGKEPRNERNHPRVRGEESNENAASEDMVITPKCKFFALFSRAAPKRRVIPNAGPGAFRLSNFCLYSSLCVPA